MTEPPRSAPGREVLIPVPAPGNVTIMASDGRAYTWVQVTRAYLSDTPDLAGDIVQSALARLDRQIAGLRRPEGERHGEH
jgi:hypothetical protein